MRGVGEEEKGEGVDVRDMGDEVKESDDVTSPVVTLPANIRTCTYMYMRKGCTQSSQLF